jgi:hypothetical protein
VSDTDVLKDEITHGWSFCFCFRLLTFFLAVATFIWSIQRAVEVQSRVEVDHVMQFQLGPTRRVRDAPPISHGQEKGEKIQARVSFVDIYIMLILAV